MERRFGKAGRGEEANDERREREGVHDRRRNEIDMGIRDGQCGEERKGRVEL